MTDLTPTIRMITNVGEDILYEAKIPITTYATSADTINVSATPGLTTSSTVKIVSCNNITGGTSHTEVTSYVAASRHFLVAYATDATMSSDEIRIEYRIVG